MNTDTHKVCPRCKVLKHREDEYAGTTGYCYPCARNYVLEKRYGVTREEYDELVKDGCNICGTIEPGKKGFHVDHCHTAGNVRGVLCHGCNVGLGMFKDDVETMQKAIEYLQLVR